MDDEYYANYNAPKVWGKIHNFHYTAFDEVEFKAPKFSIVLDSKAQKRDMDILKKYGQVIYLDNFSSAIIAPENVSKGTAIRLFLEKEKALKEKTTIYIGNDHNDISGFEACDIKIAVANADKIILRSADHIIGGNQNEGVAYYLKELLK